MPHIYKYELPDFLKKLNIEQNTYNIWLKRVTAPHLKRDKKRLNIQSISRETYKKAIHLAVKKNGERDYYTGEKLEWTNLNLFRNLEQKNIPEDLFTPSVDHENLSAENPIFRICSLQTNKCKSNYSAEELHNFCQRFIAHQGKKEIIK